MLLKDRHPDCDFVDFMIRDINNFGDEKVLQYINHVEKKSMKVWWRKIYIMAKHQLFKKRLGS